MIQEEFCPVCVAAVPLAFSLTEGTRNSIVEEKDIEKRKKRNFRMKMCIIIGILSLGVIFYFTFLRKCDECF